MSQITCLHHANDYHRAHDGHGAHDDHCGHQNHHDDHIEDASYLSGGTRRCGDATCTSVGANLPEMTKKIKLLSFSTMKMTIWQCGQCRGQSA